MNRSTSEPAYVKETSVEAIEGFPKEMVEMVKGTSPDALYLTELWYRSPWDVARARFRKCIVVVGGDAMHAMFPFISQGEGASLEDAVMLARCLSTKLKQAVNRFGQKMMIEQAMDMYVKERRIRVFWLSLQTYFIGLTIDNTSMLKKALGFAGLVLVIRYPKTHTDYDCGRL